MKRTLIFFGILCMIFFLLFSSVYRRTQFLTSLAGPGMLSLVKQASAKATASENCRASRQRTSQNRIDL